MLDTLITDAVILTMDPQRPTARSLGVWRGRVVGLDEEVAGLPARRRVSLAGRTVAPGLIDAHTHLVWAGQRALGPDLARRVDRDGVLGAVADLAAVIGKDRWVDVQGYDMRTSPMLTARDLDAVAGERPVYVVDTSGHAAILGSAAIERARLAGFSPEDLGMGRCDDGSWDGLVVENAHTAFRQSVRLPYGLEEIVDWVEHAGRTCLAQGVTTCGEAGVAGGMAGSSPIELAAYARARATGRLPVRVQALVGDDALHPVAGAAEDPVSLGLDLGLATGFGDEHLWLGAVKIWLDGGMQAQTAALTEPFHGTDHRGVLARDPAELIPRVVAAHRSGWQVALHAIGDAAVDLAIEAFAAAERAHPGTGLRHRVEHCGIVRPDQIERLAATGAFAVVQPEFMTNRGADYSAMLGPERAGWQYRGRALLDAGVPLVASSDRPVAAGDPFVGMQFMTTRTDRQGALVGPGEEVSVGEALRAYTTTAAAALGREDRLGRLVAGAHADLVVLDADPRRVPPDELGSIVVEQTWLAGEPVFETG